MIPASELRIGNWVYGTEDGEIIQWEVIASTIYCATEGFIDISPIPLTPEILQKCGFVEKDRALLEPHGFRNFIHKKAVVQLGTNIIKTWVDKMNEPAEHIQSLHQLQNLYFALTGEELNYTP